MTIKVRKEVKQFALAMEQKLVENDHKGHWKDETFDYFFHRMREEMNELKKAVCSLEDYEYGINTPEGASMADLVKKVRREAADVANFAMMVADNAERKLT